MSGDAHHVLLIEDDPDFSLLVRLNLEAMGHQVTDVTTMHDALVYLEDHADRPDVIDAVVLDLGLPDTAGLDALETTLDFTRTPVVVFTGDASPSLRRAASDAGVRGFLVKGTIALDHLDVVIRDAVTATIEPTTPDAGFASFDDFEAAVDASFAMIAAAGGPSRLALVRVVGDQQIVCCRSGPDDGLGVGTRIEFAGPLRSAHHQRQVHLGGPGDTLLRVDGVASPLGHWLAVPIEADGINHSVLVGWDPEPFELPPGLDMSLTFAARSLATIVELQTEQARAARRADLAGNAAAVDALTGLGNRRAFQGRVRAEEARCRRYGHAAAVFVIDLDKLKEVNDTLGHAAGDEYLRSAAGALVAAIRDSDFVFRLGGDEFAVLAVECDSVGATQLERRIRTYLRESDVSASLGWAERSAERSLVDAAELADGRMYEEKMSRGDRRAAPATS